MRPDQDGDDEPGGFIAIMGHFRRRPRDRQGSANGEVAGQRLDQRSRANLYNGVSSPTMLVATGREPRPWAPEQAGSSMAAELMPPKPDRGPRSGHEPADITDHAFLTTGTAPTPRNPLSAAAELHNAPIRPEHSGRQDDEPA